MFHLLRLELLFVLGQAAWDMVWSEVNRFLNEIDWSGSLLKPQNLVN